MGISIGDGPVHVERQKTFWQKAQGLDRLLFFVIVPMVVALLASVICYSAYLLYSLGLRDEVSLALTTGVCAEAFLLGQTLSWVGEEYDKIMEED